MKNALIGAAVAAMVSAGAASAGTVKVSFQQPGGLFGVNNLYQKVTVATTGPGIDREVSAGMFHMTGDGGMGDFLAFCVDLVQFIADPTTYTVDPNLYTGDTLTNMNKLFYSALGGASLGWVIDTSLEAAGLQVALWEVMLDTDNGLDLEDGAFEMSGNAAAQAQAQTYLDGMLGARDDAYDLTFLYSAEKQDVVTVSPIPLPAAGLLMMFALGGLGVASRRRKAA